MSKPVLAICPVFNKKCIFAEKAIEFMATAHAGFTISSEYLDELPVAQNSLDHFCMTMANGVPECTKSCSKLFYQQDHEKGQPLGKAIRQQCIHDTDIFKTAVDTMSFFPEFVKTYDAAEKEYFDRPRPDATAFHAAAQKANQKPTSDFDEAISRGLSKLGLKQQPMPNRSKRRY